jgi:hypothetical protein
MSELRMTIVGRAGVFLFAAFLHGVALGDLLLLGTTSPADAPLLVMPGSVTESVLVTVANNVAIDPSAADRMGGWQLGLAIVAAPGATGSLTFATPSSGTATAPNNYVFQGVTSAGIDVSVNAAQTSLLAFDATFPLAAVQVPMTPVHLLELKLQASPAAAGTFLIVATGGPANAHWTGAAPAPAINMERAFANVAFGTAVSIGAIQVAVPEASSLSLVAMVATLAWVCVAQRR